MGRGIKFPDDYPYRVLWCGQSRVLLEAEPRHRLYCFDHEDFYLPLPYVQYLVGVDGWTDRGGSFHEGGHNSFKIQRIGCTTSPVVSDEEEICKLPLPNISPDNRPCYSPVGWTRTRDEMPRGMGEAIENFWWGNGNLDYFPWGDPFIRGLMTKTEAEKYNTYMVSRVDRKTVIKRIFRRWEKLSLAKILTSNFESTPPAYAQRLTPRTMTLSRAAKVVRT